ncbi:MAG TPA: trigger factor [Clostridiaceae bacterium]|nr:trigger factor [Clostridiaceae bacterium]
MTSTVDKKEHNMVQFTITVPPEEFKKSLESAYRKNIKRFSVPGFRKGKAPYPVVVNYYGEGVLYEDAVGFAVDPAYEQALKEHDITPFSHPQLDIVEIGGENGFVFTIDVAVKPEVTLGEHKGITAYRPPVEVTEEDIEKDIERERQKVARMVPVTDRPIAVGDTVNIDFEGFKDDVAFEGGQGADYSLKIGSNSFIPGFEEGLIGKETGEEVELDLSFPEEYQSKDLAGEDVVFKVKINGITVQELPEVDDEFVKDISEFDTLAEYREDLRERLVKAANASADAEFEDNLLAALVETSEVDIPHVMIHDEMDRIVDEQRNQMRYQGIELEQYLEYMGMTLDHFKMQLHEPALNRIKSRLVIDKIVEVEGFEATDEEVTEEIKRMAELYGVDEEKFQETFAADNDYIKETTRNNKAVTFLRENGIATDVKPEPEEEPELDIPVEADEDTEAAAEEPAQESNDLESEDA